MTCEFIKIQNPNGIAIWFDLDQPFDETLFFMALKNGCGIEFLSKRPLFASVAPAQIIEEMSTNIGRFCVSKQFEDMESGIDIYSDDQALMEKILASLVSSSDFQQKTTRFIGAP